MVEWWFLAVSEPETISDFWEWDDLAMVHAVVATSDSDMCNLIDWAAHDQ